MFDPQRVWVPLVLWLALLPAVALPGAAAGEERVAFLEVTGLS